MWFLVHVDNNPSWICMSRDTGRRGRGSREGPTRKFLELLRIIRNICALASSWGNLRLDHAYFLGYHALLASFSSFTTFCFRLVLLLCISSSIVYCIVSSTSFLLSVSPVDELWSEVEWPLFPYCNTSGIFPIYLYLIHIIPHVDRVRCSSVTCRNACLFWYLCMPLESMLMKQLVSILSWDPSIFRRSRSI